MKAQADGRKAIEKRRASARARRRLRAPSKAASRGNSVEAASGGRVKAGRRPPPASGSGHPGEAGGRCGRAAPAAKRRPFSRVSPRAAIFLALVVLFAVLSASPVTRNLEATTRADRIERELKKERAVTESLEREVAEARSLEYVEREARKQRLVAPGEVLYLVTTEGPENEVTYRVKALQSMEEAWARVRQMLHSVPRAP